MAGNYPDVPNARIAFDRDGTKGYRIPNSLLPVALSQTDLNRLNDESGANGTGVSAQDDAAYWCFIFPSLRDITHWFVLGVQGSIASEYTGNTMTGFGANVQTSADTTNGVDGTWTQVATSWGVNGVVTSPYYRSMISAFPGGGAGVKAIRMKPVLSGAGFNYLVTMHLYGTITAGQTPDRLRFWHPTIDQPLSATPAALDWGDVPRTNVATKSFRIKNNSSAQTAQGVSVSINVLTEQTPTVASQYALSTDGGATWGATATIGNLAPGAISGVVQVRRSTASNAQLSVSSSRLVTAVTGWV